MTDDSGDLRHGLATALRFALRDLRGGLRGFRVMLACLAIGVGAIAAIGSFSAILQDGLARDARALLGGDVDIRLTHRPASAAQRAWLESRAEVSAVMRMRAMARRAEPRAEGRNRTLVELKGVDGRYPLFGAVRLNHPRPLGQAIARQADGRFGAVAERALMVRLGLRVGEAFTIGDARFRLTAELVTEPDMATGGFKLGPRVIVTEDAMRATGLVRPGSLIRYHYRLGYPEGTDDVAFEAALDEAFPDAGWRVRNVGDAAPRLRRYIERGAIFFTLIGLTALLVGGIGVAGAVHAHLAAKRATIATLKCLGATSGLIGTVYGIEVALITAAGIVGGLAAGALLPLALMAALNPVLPVAPEFALHARPLAVAAAFGVAVALLFTLWPLARAREVPAAALFRGLVTATRFRPPPLALLCMGASLAALVMLAVAASPRRDFALWFVIGAFAAFALFAVLGWALRALAGRALKARALARGRPLLRLALANIHRPGSPSGAIVLALGVGLTLFVALVQIEGNFRRTLSERLPADAPAYFFIDIQPGQVAAFEATVRAVPGAGEIERMPTLRGRITRAGGTPVSEIDVGPGARWALRGDRGLTYTGPMPDGARLEDGAWWPANYKGPPLASLDARIARGLGIGVGDTITINVLGREITARLANTRNIDWGTLGLNFTVIFSPGTLEGAPQTHIATVKAASEAEEALARAVTDRFENVTPIRVREALQAAAGILEGLGAAAQGTALLALIAGVLVLAGAIAAGRAERTRDAVILKVTGARKRDLALAYLIEYGLCGLWAAALASVTGSIAAWAILTRVMRLDWVPLPATAAATIAVATLAVIAFGFIGTWRALGQKPAAVLRAA